MTYEEAMEALYEAARAAVEAADNEDGAPVTALKKITIDIHSVWCTGMTKDEWCTGMTKDEFNDMRALYEDAKAGGFIR